MAGKDRRKQKKAIRDEQKKAEVGKETNRQEPKLRGCQPWVQGTRKGR